MKLDKDIFKTTASIKVLVTVENIGSVAGSEVVQVYIATPTSSIVGIPAKPLAGFAKTEKFEPRGSDTRNVEAYFESLAYPGCRIEDMEVEKGA
jgi:beta-glucosidase